MARRIREPSASGTMPSLIENTTIPLALGGGFVSALALALLSVAFFGDPLSGEPNVRTMIARTTPIDETAVPTGEPTVLEPVEGEHPPAETGDHPPPQVSLTSIDPSLLTEQGPNGLLPVVSAEGGKVMDAFARPFDKADKKPRIAILVSGLGLSLQPTQTAIEKLPPGVTLSFVPYSADVKPLVEKAHQAGHEVVLEIPMEPFDYPENDPGPYALLTQLSADENDKRLSWIMSRFIGYAGVSNYLGGQFLTARNALKPMLTTLQSRGVYFLDTSVSPGSLAVQVADEIALPARRTDVVLDVVQTKQAIDDQLANLEQKARETGRAVGVAFIYPVSIERITAWAEKLGERGFALAPVSAMLEAPAPTATSSANHDEAPSPEPGDHALPPQRGDDGHQ